ncbi:Auxin response factor [Arachis hypogaea]|uniref:Auxin response factor n=1 Tax=Arachis hypogaea TaxID=3818 RepID=A0A444XSQ0_ARAHY|nr:Auxin response factor [Arachis hypogaea]RYQ92798.1 hypothetical protein Ahy_B09g099039 [Arachis hypogaea]
MDRSRTRTTTSAIQTCLDSQLWHACAGPMVQMPPLNTKVLYFPQGHAEHEQAHAHGRKPHFAPTIKTPIPPFFPCTLTAIKYMAEPETDEVYVKITLTPLPQQHHLSDPEEHDHHCSSNHNSFLDNNNNGEKPASFAKTLTQSDANNGGGFSVPRYCAETIFPRLDYSAEPPVQTIIAKDVHGQCWKFRHIYRGTPRRHLLTTGWSNFVNHKKLVAGDSIVFLRAQNGDLCVGIRRAKKGGIAAGTATNTNITTNNNVGEAVNCAVNGRPFEVVYYPRGSSPEFCVKASSVRASMQIQWCSGMRFKMPFETEDSSRISWFMGTISSVQLSDPLHWPHSPWRLLQVVWDEPDLLQNVKCVNPWLVELVSNVPNFHLSPFSPPRKKQRFLQDQPDFQLINQFPPASSFSTIQDHQGIQGARHAHQFGLAPQDFHILDGFPRLDHAAQHPHRPSFGIYNKNNSAATKNNNNLEISCLLSVGNPGQSFNKEESCSNETKAPHILLFGKLIHTDQQNHSSNSSNSVYEGTNSSLKTSIENSSDDGGSPWFKNQHKNNDLVGTENINILCMAL